MDDLGGHGTEQMRAAGCACRWCELWQQISDARRAKKAAKIVTMADRSADPDGCWVWKHTLTPDGYGRVGWNGYEQPRRSVELAGGGCDVGGHVGADVERGA